jgi:hypothetical protein
MNEGGTMRAVLLALSLLGLAGASQAGSPLLLTGTWEGSYTCKTEAAGGSGTFKPDAPSTLQITQSVPGGPLVVVLETGGELGTYSGTVVPSATSNGEGAGAWVACGTSNSTATSAYSEIETFTYKVSADGKGTLKQNGVFVTNGGQVGVCKGTWKRIDTSSPAILGCPI